MFEGIAKLVVRDVEAVVVPVRVVKMREIMRGVPIRAGHRNTKTQLHLVVPGRTWYRTDRWAIDCDAHDRKRKLLYSS